MIDQDLKETLKDKIQTGDFSLNDIPSFFTLFCELGNEIEDLQEKVEDWNRSVNIVMQGLGAYWISIDDGRFSMGEGAIKEPDLVLTLDAVDAAQIFSGAKDAQTAYMSGALKVVGELPDAVKMQTLIEIVIEEIEY